MLGKISWMEWWATGYLSMSLGQKIQRPQRKASVQTGSHVVVIDLLLLFQRLVSLGTLRGDLNEVSKLPPSSF